MTARAVEIASRQRCARCGRETGDLDAAARCTACGGLLEVIHPPPPVRGTELRALLARRRADGSDGGSGVWRYRELVLPAAGAHIISHPEGNTPLLARDRVAEYAGVHVLHLKHEGHNPTGSFKDRGMTVGVTQARRIGARAVACASTGNTSASLAAYAAQAGLRALVFVPAGQVASGKLAQSLAYGARTLLVRGDFDACLRLVQEASERLGIYLLNSINPFRVEGQKTIALEVLEQLAWDPPDWLALPAGNLGNTAAFGKALREARELGLIDRVPRIAAVQAEGASPFAQSFREQFSTRPKVKAETVATAIRIGDPASFDRAVDAIRYTNGVVTTATDAEILDAKAVIDASGVGCEPASAASVAGVRRLVREGVIQPTERVVAVLTGHLLKDPGALLRYHQELSPRPAYANAPVEIDASLDEVERAIS
ncbi:MAG TPA: threonine synthase [Gemmatimonadaceae bacterium]|nr:threonine synthase [Gemmatimonadaceae bacterium]